MTKNAKDEPQRGSLWDHKTRMALIFGGPEPISARKFKAITNGLLSLQQEIIELADPEMCRSLLPWVTSSLDDLIESANRGASARRNFEIIETEFARRKAKIRR